MVFIFEVWLLNNKTVCIQLLTMAIDHQSKCILVTTEPSPSHVRNHVPLL